MDEVQDVGVPLGGPVEEAVVRRRSRLSWHDRWGSPSRVQDLPAPTSTTHTARTPSNGQPRPTRTLNRTRNIRQIRTNTHSSLWRYLKAEVTRGYVLEQEEERYSARREKVYTFMKIPREVEKFMAYGFFQCADAFLFVYTFLPLRFALAVWALVTRPLRRCLGRGYARMDGDRDSPLLQPAERCDLLKGIVLLGCSVLISYVDTSMMYHLIKSQSVIKLYIFFNMLEVGDRLFSSFGQDTIDALFWTAAEPAGRGHRGVGLIPHLILALVYTFLHALLVLFQATTLNVAINSNNKALLTIMMSNNFVELKGSVFKKFDKNNLFQLSCSDVRERFHLFVLLFVVVVQTMKEYAWKEERFWVLAPDCVMVLLAEVLVDWIKHAFITRFNEIPSEVYRSYTVSLAYDLAQTKQRNAFSDHSDLVARRTGFVPLPLGVVMARVMSQAVHIPDMASLALFILAYLGLTSFRLLNSIVTLGKACDLISEHQSQHPVAESAKESVAPPMSSPSRHLPPKSCSQPGSRRGSPHRPEPELPPPPPTNAADENPPLFANSTVSIPSACLNEQVLSAEDDSAAQVLLHAETNDTPTGRSRRQNSCGGRVESFCEDDPPTLK